MKKSVLLGLILLMAACFLSEAAEAHSYEMVNGVACWHGNLNFPFWDSGNSVGDFWDVGSSYRTENSNERLLITILSYSTAYERNLNGEGFEEKVYPSKLMFLYEDKHSGQLYYSYDKKNWTAVKKDSLEYRVYFNNAYYLVKQHLGLA